MIDMIHTNISSPWIWKGVSATWQIGRYTLSYPRRLLVIPSKLPLLLLLSYIGLGEFDWFDLWIFLIMYFIGRVQFWFRQVHFISSLVTCPSDMWCDIYWLILTLTETRDLWNRPASIQYKCSILHNFEKKLYSMKIFSDSFPSRKNMNMMFCNWPNICNTSPTLTLTMWGSTLVIRILRLKSIPAL